MYGSVYGAAGIVGPILGGLLAQPAVLYPGLFSKTGIFGVYPYLLICSLGSVLAVVAIYTTLFHLKEQRGGEPYHQVQGHGDEADEELDLPVDADPAHPVARLSSRSSSYNQVVTSMDGQRLASADSLLPARKVQLAQRKRDLNALGHSGSLDSLVLDSDTSLLRDESLDTHSRQPLHPHPDATDRSFRFLTWNTLGPIFLYCTIAFVNMTYNTSLPLFYSAPLQKGGLGLDSRAVGLSLSLIAGSKLFCQFFLFDRVLMWCGSARRTFMLAMFLYIPNNVLIPFLALVNGGTRWAMTLIIMVNFGLGESLGYLAVILMITESQVPENLGKAHGLASTMVRARHLTG
ncbi:hypothetical protein HDU91_001611 [Kappamyces sp. JEL0680]|nr:hypothetical protein HDU91_001611 [Kappamyces sp. JEL0680]